MSCVLTGNVSPFIKENGMDYPAMKWRDRWSNKPLKAGKGGLRNPICQHVMIMLGTVMKRVY
jgi:hypothetical protein